MVAVIAGAGVGLARSSAFVLGSQGQAGSAGLGRAGDNVYVFVAFGNLIIENTDEMLVGLGQDDVLSRTYNSLGNLSDDNGDNWRESAQRVVTGLSGTVNTAGSTVHRIDWDGSDVTYTWDATRNAYYATDGAGPYDTLRFSGSTWTWTDGSTQMQESYDAANGGRITGRTDTDGNSLAFTYNGSGQLTQVATATSAHIEYTTLNYTDANLTSVVTTYFDAASSSTKTLTRVSYGYTGGKLTSVTVDLSPGDNSTTDGAKYV